ncbi:MAG: phosphoenolpyruvate synthase regulatory protein [Rhodospirillaceae bacterium]|nr:phosphoenolpyruvate synthase regulatory protein [Rhodospirillaceae bacterium]|tara:strand:+ start:3013 stop:3816 length:804 start_codon:yes stop_codon:yes gene_type:complete
MKKLNLHLLSDATGETLQMVANATKIQFPNHETIEHIWSMIRNKSQLQNVIDNIQQNPGIVLCTLVNKELQRDLVASCRTLNIPCVDILDPIIREFKSYLHTESQNEPGIQHKLDDEYYQRIDAMHFCLAHDDGQNINGLNKADVVLVGVSRTSKTPTCMYLANKGIKAANVPYVPEIDPPKILNELNGPVVIGLTNTVDRLLELRLNRLHHLNQKTDSAYVNETSIEKEIKQARVYFNKNKWPIIDVARRSIEETAAKILMFLSHN